MTAPSSSRRFAFVFPMASGHINPSLPVARSLVHLGHEVHYLCREQMRDVVEATGSVFHSDMAQEPELYEGREADIFGAIECLKREHGVGDQGTLAAFRLMPVQAELMLPGVLRFLRELNPSAVMFCPLLNAEAALGARVLGIPSVALLTTAGLGSVAQFVVELLEKEALTVSMVQHELSTYQPRLAAVERMNAQYGLGLSPRCLGWVEPLGKLDVLSQTFATIVTTSEDLQDPASPELMAAYRRDGVSVTCVGPLLDETGALRATVHKYDAAASEHLAPRLDVDVVARIGAAKQAGRPVVLVSMGTVVTGDSIQYGWAGRMRGPDGNLRGLTGRELCQAVWAGAFDAFGARDTDGGALLLVALGPQPDALGELVAPPNAVCAPTLPQVDILKAGIDLFLTHGGQNSFTEALAHSTPVVVCPGFGDQVVNSHKAVKLGVGLKVDRPDPDAGQEATCAAEFRAGVCSALRAAVQEPAFKAAAARCAQRLRAAGGVPRAVDVVLAASASVAPIEFAEAPKEEKPQAAGPAGWAKMRASGA